MQVLIENPASAPGPVGPYSQVAKLDVGGGALLFLAGQIAVDDNGELVGEGDVGAQTQRIFEIMGDLLAAYGAGFDDVINIRTYLVNMDDIAAYGEVRRKYLTATPPTSTTVEVSRLFRPGALLEIEVTAAVSG